MLFNDPKHWRERAAEARVNAEHIHDPDAKRMMLDIAASYDRIAERAEGRLAGQPENPPHPPL